MNLSSQNQDSSSDGVKWKDEVNQTQSTPGVQRTISTKSLHMIGAAGGGGGGPQGGPPEGPMVWNQNMWPGYPPHGFQGQGFPPMMPGWGQLPGLRGMDGSWLNWSLQQEQAKAYLRSSSPSNSQKSSVKSKKSIRSVNSRRSKNARYKDRSRNNSSSQSRNASRNSRKHLHHQHSRSTDSTDSDEFYTGESEEEFVSLNSKSSGSSSRISWTCDYCTYVNNPGTKVCAMCSKTSKNESNKKEKYGKKKKKNVSSDTDSEKRKPHQKKYIDSDSDKEKDRRRRKKDKEKKKKILSESEDSYIEDAVNTYYAIRINKNKVPAKKSPDSSSESISNPMNRPNLTAPAPTKGILKKAISNPSLNRDDGDTGPAFSEAGATMSEVGYITRKMTERLRERGTVVSPEIHKRKEHKFPTDMETWSRQKEELKTWAKNQGKSQDSDNSPRVSD